MTSNLSPAETADPLQLLRQATQTVHDRFDAGLGIASEDAGLPDYLGHLRAMRSWMRETRPLWRDVEEPALRQTQRNNELRLDLIEADLCDAGIGDEAPLAAVRLPEAPINAAFLWGVAYVTEGSRLGGKVLYRRLGERLAPHPLRFFQGPADEATPAWPAFIAALRENLNGPEDLDAARQGALWAFDQAHQAHAALESAR